MLLDRLMSRFATPESEARTASPLYPIGAALRDLDADDPKSASRWMRKMGSEMGDELGGEDVDEMIDDIETRRRRRGDPTGA